VDEIIAHGLYSSVSKSEVKRILSANGQIMSGKSHEFVARAVDCAAFGGLPVCDACGVGKLRRKKSGAAGFECPGHFDSE